jgi:branched-subunit amino acid ABC-type transport system permease component
VLLLNHLHYRYPLYEPIGLFLLIVAGGYWFSKTSTGNKFRAIAENPSLLEICGTNSVNVKTLAWFIAGGLAGVAGIISPYLYSGEFTRDVKLYYLPVFISAILSEKREPWISGLFGLLVGYIQLIVILNGQENVGVFFGEYREPLTAFALAIVLYMKDRRISSPSWLSLHRRSFSRDQQ